MDKDKLIGQVMAFPAEKIADKIIKRFDLDEQTKQQVDDALAYEQLEAREKLAEIFADLALGNKMKSSVHKDMADVASKAAEQSRVGVQGKKRNVGNTLRGAFVHKGQGTRKAG